MENEDGHSEEKLQSTGYCIRRTPYSVDNAIEEANGRTAVGLVINHNHNYQDRGQPARSVLFLLLDLVLDPDRLLVFMGNSCSFSLNTDTGISSLGNDYWQLLGRP